MRNRGQSILVATPDVRRRRRTYRRPMRWIAATIVVAAAALATTASPRTSLPGAAGDLDPGFGSGGIVVDAAGPGRQVLVRADGKIYVAAGNLVGRLTDAGAWDPAFAAGGKAIDFLAARLQPEESVAPTALTLLRDGKLLVGLAQQGRVDLPATLATRLDPTTATVDGGFGEGGVWRVPAGSGVRVNGVAAWADDRIAISGQREGGNPRLWALTPAGADDPSWSGDPVWDNTQSTIEDVLVGPSDQLLAAGTSVSSDATGTRAQGWIGWPPPDGIMRNGHVEYLPREGSRWHAIAVGPAGEVVAVGEERLPTQTRLLVARYGADRRLDDVVNLQLGEGEKPLSVARDVAVAGDGTIVVAGAASGPDTDSGASSEWRTRAALLRFDATLELDPAFGDGGVATWQFGAGETPRSMFASLAIQPDGKLVAAGVASRADGADGMVVARVLVRSDVVPSPSPSPSAQPSPNPLPSPSASPTSTPAPPPAAKPSAGAPRPGTATCSRGSCASVLRCPTAASRYCHGDLSVTRGSPRVVVAHGRFHIGAGKSKRVTLKTTARGRSQLRGRRGLRCRYSIRSRDAAGHRWTRTGTITLKRR
jgi:uncharacterized delta-60 repeat protein